MASERYTVPVDTGWAWIVLAGCVLEITVYGGIMKSFGIFFIQFQQRFKSNTYETAVMGLIQNATLSICSVFVMTVGLQKFSSRVSVFIGGVLTVVGFLLTAFTTDLAMFYFGQGFLLGFGMSLIHAPELAILGIYFRKHKALANGIFTGGASIGGLIFAPIIVALFEEYNYTGAMLIISGLLMHICAGALLMRPPEFYTKKDNDFGKVSDHDSEVNIDIRESMPCIDIIEKGVPASMKEASSLHEERTRLTRSVELVPPELVTAQDSINGGTKNSKCTQEIHLLPRKRAYSVGSKVSKSPHCLGGTTDHTYRIHEGKLHAFSCAISNSQVALFVNLGESCFSSLPNVTHHEKHNDCAKSIRHSNKVSKLGCFSSIRMRITSALITIFDLHLLRNPVFLTFLLLTFTSMTAHFIVPNFIPTHAKEVGTSNENIGILIAVLAAVSLFSRIFVGIIVDRMWFSWSTAIALTSFVTGTACHLLRYVNDFPALLIFVVTVGFSSGQYHSLYAVILLDVIGPEKFNSCLGFGTLILGASSAVFFPITGKLRDNYGSYIAPYHLLGALAYFSAILVLLMPKLKTWHDSKRSRAGS